MWLRRRFSSFSRKILVSKNELGYLHLSLENVLWTKTWPVQERRYLPLQGRFLSKHEDIFIYVSEDVTSTKIFFVQERRYLHHRLQGRFLSKNEDICVSVSKMWHRQRFVCPRTKITLLQSRQCARVSSKIKFVCRDLLHQTLGLSSSNENTNLRHGIRTISFRCVKGNTLFSITEEITSLNVEDSTNSVFHRFTTFSFRE